MAAAVTRILATLLACLLLGNAYVDGLLFNHGGSHGDAELARNDDRYSSAITLSAPFRYFGNAQTRIFVSFDDIVSKGKEVLT